MNATANRRAANERVAKLQTTATRERFLAAEEDYQALIHDLDAAIVRAADQDAADALQEDYADAIREAGLYLQETHRLYSEARERWTRIRNGLE